MLLFYRNSNVVSVDKNIKRTLTPLLDSSLSIVAQLAPSVAHDTISSYATKNSLGSCYRSPIRCLI